MAVDGTLIAALASRHRMVNQKTLTDRLEVLRQVVEASKVGWRPRTSPGWMAKHPETRENQLKRYEQAQVRMDQLQAENAHRTSSKRKKPEKIVVSVSEPEAVPGRDKLKTFRPLYNVQLMYRLGLGIHHGLRLVCLPERPRHNRADARTVGGVGGQEALCCFGRLVLCGWPRFGVVRADGRDSLRSCQRERL